MKNQAAGNSLPDFVLQFIPKLSQSCPNILRQPVTISDTLPSLQHQVLNEVTMKRILPVLQAGLGALGLVILVLILSGLFQSQLAETGAGKTPTVVAVEPTQKPTKKPKIDWADATLEQVKFGKARAVLTHHGRIWIWSWLPDNRRLLLELEDPETAQFHIVTLDTKTGQVVEYGNRSEDSEPPVWIEQTQSVAFRYWISPAEPPEIRLAQASGRLQTLPASGLAGLSVQSPSGHLYYLLYTSEAIPLRVVDSPQTEMTPRLPFPSLSFPTGRPRIDMEGQHLAVIGYKDVPVLDLTNGQVQMYHIADPPIDKGLLVPQSGAWSPTSKSIGLLLGGYAFKGGLLVSRALYLLQPENSKVKSIDLPAQFVMEFDWSPKDRFLIARGTPKGAAMNQPELFWLIDSKSGAFKKLPKFLKAFTPEETFMAWSGNGRLAWIQQDKIMVSKFAPKR